MKHNLKIKSAKTLQVTYLRIITKLSIFSVLVVPLVYPVLAKAQGWDNDGSSNGDNPAGFGLLETIFKNVLGVFIPLAGAAIFTMLIIAGFTYMTSAGNPEKNAKASQTMTWAVVGLLFLIGAWFILRFISQFTGVDVTKFSVFVNP